MPPLGAKERAKLPDSAFAYIDSHGKRRLPIHDAAHVRNALARFSQVAFEDEGARDKARTRLLRAAKKHEIVLSFDRPVLIINGDADRLTQIITNLVANAVKYATPGKITLSTSLADREVSLEVSDEGPGIPPESVERIFERYYRVPTKDVGLITGTGLGLPIVRGLVELHNGRVWCSSSPIAGTTFHVVLPAPTAKPVS